MKLFYVANSRFPSERAHMTQIVHTCNAFVAQGVEVTLLVTDRPSPITEDPAAYFGTPINFIVEKLHVPDIAGNAERFPRVLWPLAYTVQRLFFARACAKRMHGQTPDIVYGRDEWVLYFLLRKIGTDRIVYESHEAKRSRPARALMSAGVPTIVISEGIWHAYADAGILKEQMLVAHDAIDASFFEAPASKNEARIRLGITNEKPVVLYIGGLEAWKGVKTFAEAAALVPGARFMVIGGKNEEVEAYRRRYPDVRFLGSRPYRELRDNQQAADVLVVPNSARNDLSARYTSPLKIFAHMASWVPLVCADVPSLRNIVDDSEVTFFTPDDPEALGVAIRSVLGDPKTAAEKAARAYEKAKRYTWNVRAAAILQFLRKN